MKFIIGIIFFILFIIFTNGIFVQSINDVPIVIVLCTVLLTDDQELYKYVLFMSNIVHYDW